MKSASNSNYSTAVIEVIAKDEMNCSLGRGILGIGWIYQNISDVVSGNLGNGNIVNPNLSYGSAGGGAISGYEFAPDAPAVPAGVSYGSAGGGEISGYEFATGTPAAPAGGGPSPR